MGMSQVRHRKNHHADHLPSSMHRRHRLAALPVCPMAFSARPQCTAAAPTCHLQPDCGIRMGGRHHFGHRGRCIRTCGGSQAFNAPAMATTLVPDGWPFVGTAAFPSHARASSCGGGTQQLTQAYIPSRRDLIQTSSINVNVASATCLLEQQTFMTSHKDMLALAQPCRPSTLNSSHNYRPILKLDARDQRSLTKAPRSFNTPYGTLIVTHQSPDRV